MKSDIRQALRSLAKSPAFTAVVVLTLALGIGASTTSYSFLNSLLFRPLPLIQHQERMLWLNEAVPSKGIDSTDICYADFLAWRARSKTLDALWVFDERTVILGDKKKPERVLGSGLSAGAFEAMGVRPVLGRDFRPEEFTPGAQPAALISHGFWERHFGGDPEVLGEVVTLNGEPTTIIGVMPKGWRYPDTSEIWQPLRLSNEASASDHGNFNYSGHAMLKPGVSLDEARSELAAISDSLAREFPATNEGLTAVLRPVREEATDDTASGTILIFGAVLFVFLIACANVINLLLARGSTRMREIAVRQALGATRGRIIRQLMVESLMLGTAGGLLGLLAGVWGLDLVLSLIPVEIPFWLRFGFDGNVYAFAAGLSLAGTVLFGLIPAWQSSHPRILDHVREGGRGTLGTPRGNRMRQALVAAEIALALVLLVGAGLTMRSFMVLNQVAPGFDAAGVLTFRVGFPSAMMKGDESVPARFHKELVERLSAMPGVESAAAVSALPALGIGGYSEIFVEGEPEPANFSAVPHALIRSATPRFFETLHIPLLDGRVFTDTDDAKHPKVAVVDTDFAKRFFPDQNPVGKRFKTSASAPGREPQWIEIVGVVGATRRWFDRDGPVTGFYLAQQQSAPNFMSVVVRTKGDPSLFVEPARDAVLALDPDMPIYNVVKLDTAIARSDSMWKRRFFQSLFAIFSGLAMLLAAIGVYGVMSHAVSQRTQEFGVRMALGARAMDIMRLVVRNGIAPVVLGLAAGLLGAWFVAKLISQELYGVSVHDPATFAVVPAFIVLVAIAACLIPARRATKVDPMTALRTE